MAAAVQLRRPSLDAAAVLGAEVIFLTGPIHKQRTYAMVLADHLSDGQVLVLAPGRSLGCGRGRLDAATGRMQPQT